MAAESRSPSTQVPVVIALALVVVLGLGGILAGSKKKSSKGKSAAPGTRAVIVPARARPLTFAIPPCGTGQKLTPARAGEQLQVQGAAVFELPPSRSPRTVQVLPCGSQAGTPPAAAFVLAGRRGGGKAGTQLQLVIPNGSAATTVVVPPCTRKAKRGASVLPTPAGGSGAALAPRC
jgi:hypothetical protein